MVIAVFLIVLGAIGPIAAVQWRAGRWLDAARWIARNSSVHVLYATPVAGLLLASLGLSIIWPPGIVLVFLSAVAFMGALLASPHRGRVTSPDESAPEERPTSSPRVRAEPGTSGPFSSRAQAGRGADRSGSERQGTERTAAERPQPSRRATGRPSPARRDARRAG
jgi:hypothetical protein